MRADFSVVTPDIREEVIGRIRKEADGPLQKLNLGGLSDYRLLVRLGDRKTMEELVSSTRDAFLGKSQFAFHEELGRSAQPALIPMIAEDFFRNDGSEVKWKQDDDVAYASRPFSIIMCRVALEIAYRSDAFADATRKWARDTIWKTDENPTLTRELLQQWWQANEKSFGQRDYHAVLPGRELPLPTTMAASPGPPPPNESEPQPKSAPPELNDGSAKMVPTSNAVTQNKSSAHLLFFAIGIAVMLIATLMWKKRN